MPRARLAVQIINPARYKKLGNTPYRSVVRVVRMISAVMTMLAMHDELRDLHAARFAEMAALREMLAVHGPTGHGQLDAALADRMRDSVAEILRLQRIISLIQE